MSKLIKKFLTLDTSANGVNAQVIPANFASPANYTPTQVASEGSLEISSHLKGIDTALGLTEKTANKGAANGYAPLDGSGKVPVANLPSAIMEYQGSWNPTTNTPTLNDSTGVNGNVYWVSALYAGPISGLSDSSMVNFQIGDIVIYSSAAGKWQLVTPAAGVSSVNGSQGAVTVNAINQLTGDVTTSAASGSQSKAATISAGAVTASKLGTVTDGITLDQSGAGSTLEVKAGGISSTQLASAAVTPAKLGSVTDGVTLDQSGSGSTIEIKALGVGTAQIAAGAVTAAKLGSVSDGVTIDQSGSGSTLEVVAGGIGTTQLAASSVTNAKMANMAADTIKGNNTGSSAAPIDLTGTQVVAILPTATSSVNGVLSSTDWSTFNGKQAALGFTPENVANKSTDGTMAANSTTLYPSQSAVVTYVGAQISAIPAAAQAAEDVWTLNSTDISNGYKDLAHAAKNAACIELTPVGGIMQQKTVDYSISLTGGTGGVTRITWTALGLAGLLASGDVVIVDYLY